jgi:hypothetical protein
MATNDYHFVSRWRVEGSAQDVYEILFDAGGRVHWWRDVFLDVQFLEPGDERGVGQVVRLLTKGWLPYKLRWQYRITDVRPPYGFALEASGDFVGGGIWSLKQDGPRVDVVYDWRIRVDKPLIRWLSFLLKPLFAANHRWAMRRGEEGLRRELARRGKQTLPR